MLPQPSNDSGDLSKISFTDQPGLDPDASSDSSDNDESSIGSEYDRYCNAVDIDVDIAATHERNEELRSRPAVVQFFKEIENIDTIEDDEKREWLGSLPSVMCNEAIPLFTDTDTDTDYQLHLAYTSMKSLHTFDFSTTVSRHAVSHECDKLPDYYVHSLLRITTDNKTGLVSDPNVVIPLGKLFVNRSGRSDWTGFEVFVSSRMELWMIQTSDAHGVGGMDPVKFSPWIPKPVPSILSQMHIEGSGFGRARFWVHLKSLASATSQEAARLVWRSARLLWRSEYDYHADTYYLLEMARSDVPRALRLSKNRAYNILQTAKLELDAGSRAAQELLLLASQNPKQPVVKLRFVPSLQAPQFVDRQLSLRELVMKYDDKAILNLLFKRDMAELPLHPPTEAKAETSSPHPPGVLGLHSHKHSVSADLMADQRQKLKSNELANRAASDVGEPR